MKKHILFVDDEPHVLDGLRRMLRPLRHVWDIVCVQSGQEALALLAQAPFDVVVSDMRMPGMDGAQLLMQVRERYPHIVRIILSGQIDHEMTLRAVGPAHQYLAKPCDAAIIQETVSRACALHELLADATLRQLVAGMQTLPSLPTLYIAVMEVMDAPNSALAPVGKLIERDIGMAAKLLQLVNSAFFGLGRRIASPTQAVSLLGLETVASLILSSHIFACCDQATMAPLALDALWSHSLATAVCARAIARAEHGEPQMVEDAFMAGLLHDAGKLVFAANLPQRYGQARTLALEQGLTECEAERVVLGATHAEVGAYLLGLWGLPHPIVEALAFHHCPSACVGRTFSPLAAVHVANALVYEGNPADTAVPVDLEYLAALGLSERLSGWREHCQAAPT